MTPFVLDTQLARDSRVVTDFPLCRLLLMNDARFVWFILVPRVAGVQEAIDLDARDYQRLWDESAALCRALRSAFAPHKLNVAALGNVVAQLHVHHIARYHHDEAWPAPVWGRGEARALSEEEARARIDRLATWLPTPLRPAGTKAGAALASGAAEG